MRRRFALAVLVLCALIGLTARPNGQRPPTISDDLRQPGRPGDRIRVIVQGPDDADVSALRGHLRGVVRRELAGAVALEVTRGEFDAMSRDAAFAHISVDALVTGDMAITNKVTAATTVWQGSGGLLGLFGTPGYNG